MHTSQLAEQTIFQLHVYTKIKSQDKNLSAFRKSGPLYALTLYIIAFWNGCCCCFAKRIVTITMLTDSACRKKTHLPQEDGKSLKPLPFQGACLSNVTGSKDSERCLSPCSSPIVIQHTLSCCANFRSYLIILKGHVSSRVKHENN